MPSTKSKCSKCLGRHVPPTGKKCKYLLADDVDEVQGHSSTPASPVKCQSSEKASDVQTKILEQLERVNSRLDHMEDEVAQVKQHSAKQKKISSLSLASKSSSVQESDSSSDESLVPSLSMLKSSKDIQQQVDSRLRELEECSFVQGNQKQKLKSKRGGNVDYIVSKKVAWPHDSILGGTTKQRLSYDQLTWSQWVQGFARNILDKKSQKTREIMLTYLSDLMEDTTDFSWQGAKLKSKRGGNVDYIVSKKVAWPHDSILGGTTKQRLSYDQLTWSQWVQGFARNILDKKSQKTREIMLTYLSDLMEDTTDFSWQGAKASHAVLLCEMESGAVTWSDTGRIDRIRRAHAQKHVTTSRFFGRSNDSGNKRPWFCKFFQSGTCSHSTDHETNGRLHRHICAHCLENGKQLNHSEKDCRAKKSSKNE